MAEMNITVEQNGQQAPVWIQNDDNAFTTNRGAVKGKDLQVGDMVCVMSDCPMVQIVSIP